MEWNFSTLTLADFKRPCAGCLCRLNLTPNMPLYWILFAAAEALRDNPACITALRCQLYAEMVERLGRYYSANAIDCIIRRACDDYAKRGRYAELRAYLPKGMKKPRPAYFMAAWAQMLAEAGYDELKNV